MSNNEDDKPDLGGKLFPLDLASKLTVKPVEVPKGTSLMMTTQPLRGMRVLTQAIPGSGAPTQTISIVPQALIKPGESLQPRAQLTGIISSGHVPGQQTTIRSTGAAQITLAAAGTSIVGQNQSSTGTTYHVPRGPAVVANLATPRSAVATPIRATTPTGQSTTGFVTAVRQVTPARTPSPATTALPGTAWLSNSGMQVSSGPQLVKSVIHSFKSASGIQQLGNTVTLAQVLPTRTQTLVYSGTNTQHFTPSPRLAVTGTINSQRPNSARPGQVMTTRLTVPVTVPQGSTRLTVTPSGPGTIYTTSARLSALPASGPSAVIGGANTARVSISNPQQQPQQRLSVTSPPGALLTTAPARLTVTNQQQQPPAAVVIATQAGRLAASVVSLHPVVVGNTSQNVRTIQAHGPKVITQPNPSVQLAQMSTVAKLPTQQQVTYVPVTVASTTTVSTRTISVTPAALVSQRPVAMAVASTGAPGQAIPIAKVFPQGTSNLERNLVTTSATPITTSYSIPSGATGSSTAAPGAIPTYYYESGTTGYAVTGASNLVARPYTQPTGSFNTVPVNSGTATAQIRSGGAQVHSIISGQPIQFNPIMVVEQKRNQTQFLDTSGGNICPTTVPQQQQQQQDHTINSLPSISKMTSSPRPSILRKRDNEGSPLKAAKNLAPVLATLSAPASPPSRPESRGNGGGQSSSGSTTISATSSPGLGEHGDDSLPLPPVGLTTVPAAAALKLEQQQHRRQQEEERPMEMSPRKKPRKQQLVGNDLHNPKFNIDDMQFLSEHKTRKEPENNGLQTRDSNNHHHHNQEPRNEVTVRKPASASLLNSYRQTWKSTQSHYLRYTDVKPKDERRPTIIDLANQNHVLQKINGWKVHHLTTQMEDLAELEIQVYDQLSSMLKLIETKDCPVHDKEVNRINELIKGNMQRSKIINDSMVEAKVQVMKVFDHKDHVADIINRCASKRNFKKREKF